MGSILLRSCLQHLNQPSAAVLSSAGHLLRGRSVRQQHHWRPSGPSLVPEVSPVLDYGLSQAVGRRTFFNSVSEPSSKKYSERKLLGYSPQQLYAVVAGVEDYHRFVPWCCRSHVLRRAKDGTYLEAELEVGFQMLNERYVSKVKLQPPNMVHSSSGQSHLFKHLDSTWALHPGPLPNTTWLTFNVDFAFQSVLYSHITDLFFSEVVQRMMAAFEGRCQQLYGPSSMLPGRAQQQQQQQQQVSSGSQTCRQQVLQHKHIQQQQQRRLDTQQGVQQQAAVDQHRGLPLPPAASADGQGG